MFKKAITKINNNIDKAMDFRNKMFMRTLILWGLTAAAYAGHYFDFMSALCYFLQVVFVIMSLFTLAISGFITYVQVVITSKVEAVSFGGTKTRMVVDTVRDKAVEKIRDIKEEKEEEEKIKNTENIAS